MIKEFHYSTPDQAVAGIIDRAILDIDFVKRIFPFNGDLDALFAEVKKKLIYTSDPDDVELIQRPRTLLTRLNELGPPGSGDCDDFSALAVSLAYAYDIPCIIVLAGRTQRSPVHVYTMFYDRNVDRWRKFDLTAPSMDKSNPYKFEQYIEVK